MSVQLTMSFGNWGSDKIYFALKVIITQICITLFVLQSHQEVIKYFSGLTSVSTRTEAVLDLRYPIIAICLTEPFKVMITYYRSV